MESTLSEYYVKRNNCSKIQGPYPVSRLVRYVQEQRIWLSDEISKDGVNWKKAGTFEVLFPIYVEPDVDTYSLSFPEYNLPAEKDVSSDTVSTILEHMDSDPQGIDLDEDDSFSYNNRAEQRASYLMFCTVFVFGVSFGFGLFLTLSSIVS